STIAQQSDWRLCWLKDLADELREEGAPVLTSTGILDRLLISRLSLDPKIMARSDDPDIINVLAGMVQDETVFEYLTGCWKRLHAANREVSRLNFTSSEKERWRITSDKTRNLLLSYCGMTLEDPSMFPQPDTKPTGPAEFLPILLALTPSGPGTTPSDHSSAHISHNALGPSDLLPFLNDMALVAEQAISEIITPTLSLFFQEWFKLPRPDILGDEWRRYLGAVVTLVLVKPIAACLPSLSIWMASGVTPEKVEWQSLLGPLTRLSVYPREFPQIWKLNFSNPTNRKRADIDANKSNLRHTLNSLQNSLFTIYNSIIRASPAAREEVLHFFGLVARLNQKRAGMQVDYRNVSSDGFMTNLHYVLLKLFEPAMDVRYSKIDKVDPEYLRSSKLVEIGDETKIRASKEEADEYYSISVEKSSNFITEVFYLCNVFQHLGIVKTIAQRGKAERNMIDIEKQLKQSEASRAEWTGNPALEAQGEAAIAKLKADLAILHASLHAYDTQLLDPVFYRLNLTFLGFMMTWLVRLVDPHRHHPSPTITLPLSSEAPQQFRMLPEYFFDNVVEYCDFLSRYDPNAFDSSDKDTFITFAITFLSPGYVNNPFLKAKLVSVLAHGLYPVGYWRKGPMFDRLSYHPLSTQYLMPTLIRFFIDVEMTGGHTQFWDKFNFRRDISRIVKSMWENPLHREAFVQSRKDDFDQFIKFINMLMSDTTFHLEESLTNLAKINHIESLKANAAEWDDRPETERSDLAQQLRQAESSAPFHTQMGLDHVKLIRDFTATTKEPFVTAEIVDRLAATLDENVVMLVGPKMQDLRVADPDRFSFKPKELLAAIAQIYLNLAGEADFIRAVANDGRSYSKELFERFARILKNRAIMTDAEVAEVISFTQKVEDMRATVMMEDERDIPDEFLGGSLPLMKDPVILPVSRVVIDRSTIRTVLLSKELDPFNNMPLKLEDCIPDTELKAKIDAWSADTAVKRSDVMEVDDL
ncbi:ubiquitin-conjugation factor E4 B, partial [Tremella mesenterica]